MNTKNLGVALVLSLASAAAFAGNPAWPSAHPDEDTATVASTPRSPMHADAGPAIDGMQVAYGLAQAPGSAPAASTVTRAQVREELARARASGALDTGVLAYGAPATVHGGNASSDLAVGHGAARSN
jgi:hypothetical protein